MSAAPPFDGHVYIADKSAWEVAHHASVAAEWSAAIIAGQIATCAVVKLEILYSARTNAEWIELSEDLDALRNIAVTQSVCQAALGAMGSLSARSNRYHRVAPPDYLIAAAAQDVGIGVLHYDAHYDRLAQALNFDSRWIGPRGTLV